VPATHGAWYVLLVVLYNKEGVPAVVPGRQSELGVAAKGQNTI
jgi:hypothetical protein